MYLALYRKYRPATFDDVIGQPHITKTLKNEVAQSHTAHAYLFTGPRGTGKTTCSKVLAMAVNCEHPIDGNPCLTCESCKAIAQGSTLDVVEIDAASNNGVDNIRDLRDEASYTPTSCKYRVYIIDETHMLSAGAFNALLKIMEEPPPHVKFILATTEAHKVPATILSRCQRFDFRRIKSEEIKKLLLSCAQKETFSLTDEAADLIARLCDGGMRDAFSILDQCAAFSDTVDLACVAAAAGIVSRDYLFEFTDCLVENNAPRALKLIDTLYSMSKDLQGLLEEFIHHLRNIMLLSTLKDTSDLIVALPEEISKMKEYTLKLPLSTLLFALSLLQRCMDDMAKSSNKRLTLEMCMITLCTPSLNVDNTAILSRLDRLEMRPMAPIQQPQIAQAPPQIEPPQIETAFEPPPIEQPQIAPQQTSPPQIAPPISSAKSEEPRLQWAEILEAFSKINPGLSGILQNANAAIKGEYLYITSENSIMSSLMKQEKNAAKLLAIVEEQTGTRYKIRIQNSAKQEEVQQMSLFQSIIKTAKENGIPVNEE